MAQQGQLFKRNGAWHVRYRVRQLVGRKLITVQESHRLASISDYPLRSEVEELRQEYMMTLNRTSNSPQAGSTIGEFVEHVYFPGAERRLAEATVAGYRKGWKTHLKCRMPTGACAISDPAMFSKYLTRSKTSMAKG